MFKKLILTTLALMFAASLSAQTVDEIIAKNIEAKGGYDKLKSIKTMQATGQFTAQNGMVQGTITLYNKRPNKMRMNMDIQGQTMVQAFDGTTGWMIIPFMGTTEPQRMPEEQVKSMKSNADMDGVLVDYKKKGHKVELLGKEELEGTDVYKLKVTRKDSSVQYLYLDSDYYIELKMSTVIKSKGTEQMFDTYLSDYKEVDGTMVPFAIEQKKGDMLLSQITLSEVKYNVDIDDSYFAMPEKKKEPASGQ